MVPPYAQPWDKEVERRVVRKIDLALIPLMFVGYGLVYYDKVSLPLWFLEAGEKQRWVAEGYPGKEIPNNEG